MIFFQDLWWFAIFFAASLVFFIAVSRANSGPLKKVVLTIGFFGVAVHEISHFITSKLARVPTDNIKVRYRSEVSGNISPHGSVGLKEPERLSFMQAFMTSLAPLFVGTWTCLLLLDLAFTSTVPFVQILSFLGAISVFFGAAPSGADVNIIIQAFSLDVLRSLYQACLAVVACLLAFLIFTEYVLIDLLFTYPFLIYFFVIAFYLSLKYALKGLNALRHLLFRSRDAARNEVGNFQRYRRKTLKPRAPWKTKNRDDGRW